MAIERAPIRAGEFIGHRVWEVHLFDSVPTLRSWVYNCFWHPGGVVSDISYIDPPMHDGGIEDNNQRGVWGFKTKELLIEDFKAYYLANKLVYGTCYMWGTVIEHEHGYRAQHARVLTLDTVGDSCNEDWYYGTRSYCAIDLDFLRARYGVS